jgi:hypothetical protein
MITLIKWLIKCFFKSELEEYKNQYLTESKQILKDTKDGITKKYVKFNVVPINSEAFIAGMSPLYNNNNVLSWLLGHQDQCRIIVNQSMLENNDKKALNAVAQSSIIDGLLEDLQKFEMQYMEILERKKLKGEVNNA